MGKGGASQTSVPFPKVAKFDKARVCHKLKPMPPRKRKPKTLTLERLARMMNFGFAEVKRRLDEVDEKTNTHLGEVHSRIVEVDGQIEKLAGFANEEFVAIRNDMATKAEVGVLREDLRILRTDMEGGFQTLGATLKELLAEVRELRAMDAELTDLRMRVKRLEKKLGIA